MSWGAGLDKRMYAFFKKHMVDWFGFDGRDVTLGGNDYKVYLYDENSRIFLLTGTTAPDGLAGFAKGAFFIKTDGGAGTRAIYENIGTTAVSDFNCIGDFIPADITLAQGSVLVGNAGGVAAAISAKTDGAVLIGNGTTTAAKVISGAITLDNLGATTIPLSDAKILVGDVGDEAAAQALGGDAGIVAAGTLSLADEFKKRSVTPLATIGAGTLLAAAVKTGLIQRDPAGGSRTDTFDTAANLKAIFANPVVGSFIEFAIQNTSDAGDLSEVITLAVPANVVIVPATVKIYESQVCKFRLYITNATTPTLAIHLMETQALRGTLVRGTSDLLNVPFVAKTAGQVVMGDGTDVISQAISGDVELAGDGVVSLNSIYKSIEGSSINGDDQLWTVDVINKGIVVRDTLTGPSTDTIPDPADILAARTDNVQLGTRLEFYVRNNGDFDITVADTAMFLTDSGGAIIPSKSIMKFTGYFMMLTPAVQTYGSWTACVNRPAAGDRILMTQGANMPGSRPVEMTGDVTIDSSGVTVVGALPKIVTPSISTPIADATAGPITITAAMMLSGLLLRDCNGASRNDTLDTAANLVAAIGVGGWTPAVGQVIEFAVYNNSILGELLQFTMPIDITAVAAAAYSIGPGQSTKFLVVLTDVSGGTEAADVYYVPTPAISNDHVTAAAAIAMSKLDLAITDTEVDAAAAIVGSKIIPHFAEVVHEKTSVSTEATAGDAQYNVADVLTGFLDRDCDGGARADTLPDADDLVAGLADAYVGQTWECLITNTSAGATAITLTGGVDCTLRPTPITISQDKTAQIRFVLTNVGGGTEAYSAYLISQLA